MKAKIFPGINAQASVRIPASKSLSHRALIAAGLADGISRIENLVENKDTAATMECLKKLGASFEKEGNTWVVRGIHDFTDYDGTLVDCSESGSTLRFMIPLFSQTGKEVLFTGHGKLMERPQTVYEELYHEEGLLFEKEGQILRVCGKPEKTHYVVKGNISSQFISGLLFVLPLADHDSVVEIVPPYESASYVGLTEDVLENAGIEIEDEGLLLKIKGRQQYHPIHITIDGDDSQAAFFACLSMIANRVIDIHGMAKDSRQGDHQILNIIRNMGGQYEWIGDGYRFVPGKLKSAEIDLQDCPDLGPVLFAMAACAEGTTHFFNAKRLRIKESDRIECMEMELRKLGCDMISTEDEVFITGKNELKGNVMLDGHNDHRIVMALSVLSIAAEQPVVIDDAQAIQKSYPAFFEDLMNMGVKVEKHD